MSKIKLNLEDQDALFSVVNFLSNIDIAEESADKLSKIDFNATGGEAKMGVLVFQALGKSLSNSREELNGLLAELADVSVEEINNLNAIEYLKLFTSFLEVNSSE